MAHAHASIFTAHSQHIHSTCKCAHSTCTSHVFSDGSCADKMLRACSTHRRKLTYTQHADVTYTIHTHTYTSHTYMEQHTLILNVIGLDMIGSLAKHQLNSKTFRLLSSSCHQKTTDVDHWMAAKMFDIQWNPSIADTMGPPLHVRIIEASIFQRLPVYFR